MFPKNLLDDFFFRVCKIKSKSETTAKNQVPIIDDVLDPIKVAKLKSINYLQKMLYLRNPESFRREFKFKDAVDKMPDQKVVLTGENENLK